MLARLYCHWPLAAALAVLWLTAAVLLGLSLQANQGHLVYSLDDAYIHMAIAKHTSQHGVWGLTRYQFTSAVSSLLWPLLLAACYLPAGPWEAAPLALNLIFASALLTGGYLLLRRQGCPPGYMLAVLLVVIFLTPLPTLVFAGMEHCLQACAALVFLLLAASALAAPKPGRETGFLLAAAPVLTATRYEHAGLVALVAALLTLRRRPLLAAALLAGGALPLVAYGLVATSHGWPFLPTPVLLKGLLYQPPYRGLPHFIYSRLQASPLFSLVLVAVPLYILGFDRQQGCWHRRQLLLLLFVAGALCQALLHRSSDLRYHAYLVGVGVLCLAGPLYRAPAPRRRLAVALLVLTALFLLPVGGRVQSLRLIVPATTNIYQQQYQMAHFLQRYYRGAVVGVNDVGAVSYYADVRLLDLWGLGNAQVARARLAGRYQRPHFDQITRQARLQVAIIYHTWFTMLIPAHWRRAGTWTIPHNVACGQDTVAFYAPSAAGARRLSRQLRAYSPSLPKPVLQAIY